MRGCIIILLICSMILPSAAFQITEFCPDPYLYNDPDEYLVLEGAGSLDGIMITDGEGSFRFPEEAEITADRITIARRASDFMRSHGFMPDYEIYDTSGDVPDVIRTGTFRLANTKDELVLCRDGVTIQSIAWPDALSTREGQIHFLQDGVWDPRPLFIGQSRFMPETFDGVTVTVFVSPDSAAEVFDRAVADADSELLINVYEFTDQALASCIIDAKTRGAAVTVLVEGGPVGGIQPEERYVCTMMNAAGIPVYQMKDAGDAHAKYRFNHAKYMVVDDSGVLITSENFKTTGIPPRGTQGNRGWGVYVHDTGCAAYFREVFAWDSSGGDVIPLEGQASTPLTPDAAPYTEEFPPATFTGARVTPVLAPDTTSLIIAMLESAGESIEVEQAYIKNTSGGSLNPFLEAAVDASRRGVSVRVLLDSSWFNTCAENDNDEMVEVINAIAAREGLPLVAKCADLEANNLVKLHNKGVIIDGRSVLISSINWNTNSPAFNREAGVIIEHQGVAAYYAAVFEDDWNAGGAAGSPAKEEGGIDQLKIAAGMVVVGVLAGLYFHRHLR